MVGNFDDIGSSSTDEFDIVRDKDDGTLVGPNRFLQSLSSIQIEVRRRFIQNEKIRFSGMYSCEAKADFFTTGEDPGKLKSLIAAKSEGAKKRTCLCFGHGFVFAADDIDKGTIRRNGFGKILRQITGDDLVAENDFSLGWRTFAGQQTRQCRFSKTVKADNRDMFAVLNVKRNVSKDEILSVIGESRVANGKNRNAAMVVWRKAQLTVCRGLARDDDGLEFFECLDTGLHQRGLVGLRPEGIDEFLHVCALTVLISFCGEQDLVALLTFLQVIVQASRIPGCGFAVDFDGDRRQCPEQIAIVGNQQKRSAIASEEGLHPFYGGEIKVVRRFVEHEQIRLGNQRPHHFGSHFPTAREFSERTVEIIGMKTERAEGFFDAGFQFVATQLFETGLQFADTGQSPCPFRGALREGRNTFLQCLDLVFASLQILTGTQGIGKKRIAFGPVEQLLVEISDGWFRTFKQNRSAIRLQFTGQQIEERRLAGAVRSDDADAFVIADSKRNIPENLLRSEMQTDILK